MGPMPPTNSSEQSRSSLASVVQREPSVVRGGILRKADEFRFGRRDVVNEKMIRLTEMDIHAIRRCLQRRCMGLGFGDRSLSSRPRFNLARDCVVGTCVTMATRNRCSKAHRSGKSRLGVMDPAAAPEIARP